MEVVAKGGINATVPKSLVNNWQNMVLSISDGNLSSGLLVFGLRVIRKKILGGEHVRMHISLLLRLLLVFSPKISVGQLRR